MHGPQLCKLARAGSIQYYTVPFRAVNMKKHVEKQHPDIFAEYDLLCIDERDFYSEQRIARHITLQAHFCGENKHVSTVSKHTVGACIGNILFDQDDDIANCTGE